MLLLPLRFQGNYKRQFAFISWKAGAKGEIWFAVQAL